MNLVTRKLMESRFHRDFRDVRLHEGAQAAASASSIRARAYTAGRNIVLGSGVDESTHLGILAHELAHVEQQRSRSRAAMSELAIGPAGGVFERAASQAASQAISPLRASIAPQPAIPSHGPALVQRVGVWESIARFFGGGTFPTAELDAYLIYLETHNRIEDDFDSDQKAEAVVNIWKQGQGQYNLTPRIKTLLIQEMQSGFTGTDQELAILELLERSTNTELSVIFSAITPSDLNSDFHWAEWDRLQDFYRRRFVGGLESVLAGQIRPIGEAVPLGRPLPAQHAANLVDDRQHRSTCSVSNPAACATYAEWISAFENLPTFEARSGHNVIGAKAAPRSTATDITAPPTARRPRVIESTRDYLPTDRFIDGPTDAWVRANLPENLIATAYQLPSDCADLAVILRHVWLSAHHRVETYDPGSGPDWVIGSTTGAARSRHILELISRGTSNPNQQIIYSANVARTLNPYADEHGRPIRSFAQLEPLLHPGDALVWEHRNAQGRRTGGHTQTVVRLTPGQGSVSSITVLQGNQPIGPLEAGFIRDQAEEAGNLATTPSIEQLREAPGRRIEVSTMTGNRLRDDPDSGVWTWPDGTVLVAAGPAAAAPQPAIRRRRGRQRRFIDWAESLKTASNAQLQGIFEAALLEARAMLEGEQDLRPADAREVGRAAGEQIWRFAREAGDLAHESHYQRLELFRQIVESIRDGSYSGDAQRTFNALLEAFNLAARGATGIDFDRRASQDTRVLKVLVTGFDPFYGGNPGYAPRRGDWNPSAAAALALDGRRIEIDRNTVVAVESVVLPVDYDQFRSGLVESILQQPAVRDVDAIITVSLDRSIAPDQPVDIERYAVGVHHLMEGNRLESIPAAPGGQSGTPLIIESNAPVEDIARETAAPAQGSQPQIRQPTIGTNIELAFSNVTSANRALSALGLPAQNQASVTITDPRAIRQILSTMSRSGSSQFGGISFSAATGQTFQATVVSGPGGSFLSNEVSYRALRYIQGQSATDQPLSFHVHTQRGAQDTFGTLPEDLTSAEGRKALALAQDVRSTLIRTLERLIISVAKRAN